MIRDIILIDQDLCNGRVERPTYEDLLLGQVSEAVRTGGRGRLEDLLDNGETWTVN